MRILVSSIQKMNEKELKKSLPKVREMVAEKLEDSSVFRTSPFPKRFRSEVKSPGDLQNLLEEVYEFAFEQKVWLGL